MSFLKAEWRKLAIFNYETDVSVLKDYLPFGTEPDLWNGKCYVSLIGFMFVNTRVFGIKIPFHTNFEEVNLRFYVKRQVNGDWRRGVVFIKEIVPRPVISLVANTIYKENYETMPMRHHWRTNQQKLEVAYSWKKKNNLQTLKVVARPEAILIETGSEAEFITEHYWGYAKITESKSNEYEVRHPRWLQYAVLSSGVDVDFGFTFGPQFGFLDNSKPASVMLAEGSEISVENHFVIM